MTPGGPAGSGGRRGYCDGVRRVTLALTAATLTLLGLTAVSCDDDTGEIGIGEAARADVVEVVDAPATVVARAAATLTAAADGTLAELHVAAGEEVSEGQILAVVDSPSAERQLAQAGQALEAADRAAQAAPAGSGAAGASELIATQRATDEAASVAFDRAREAAAHIGAEDLRASLLAQVDAAEQRYAAASAAARETVTAVRQGVDSLSAAMAAMGTAQQLQAQQAYELTEATVEALTLRAPFDGMVQLGGVSADQPPGGIDDLLGAVTGGLTGEPGGAPGVDPAVAAGAQVGPGTPVLTVIDVAELSLIAEVDETDVLLVAEDVAGEVELDAAPGARYQAAVDAVDLLPTASARGGIAYRVRLELGDGRWPDGTAAPRPRPGMSAIAHLRVREARAAVAVPAAAVLRLEGVDVVWAVRDGRATRTEVRLGAQGQDLVEVEDGLASGDRVVVRGADLVTEGQRLP